jgi:hypothetical protein
VGIGAVGLLNESFLTRALEAVRRAAQATPGEVEEILEEAAAEEAS